MTALPFGSRPFRILHRLAPAAAILALLAGPAAAEAVAGNSPLMEATRLSDSEFYSVNGSAKGLAGVSSQGATWENTSEWKAYEQWMDGRWNYIHRVRLGAMQAWSNGALGDLRGQSQTVYYPFSGPDFLYVNALFPDAKFLIMAGLEPVGSMPDLASLTATGGLNSYLQQIKTSLFTILAASFFKTKDMKNDFHGQVNGLVPALALFLAREGYTIDSLRYGSLGHDGTLHPEDAGGATVVQITYFQGDRDDSHVLIYCQADLGNDGLHENPGFVHLMERLGPGITYLKAASYLLYEGYFDTMRDAILDNSIGVVEDDSGIPLRDFNPKKWTVTPYGNYTGPIGLFKNYNQPDLTQFYAANPHAPLSFGSGYKYIAANSSLLVARKK